MQESTAVSTRSVPTATGYVTIHFAPGGTKRPLAGSEEEQEDMSPSLDPKSGGHARCAQPHLLDNEYSQTTNNSAAVAAPAQSAPKRIRPSREGVRRGKWTAEEQAYADRLIRNFENGLLPLENGATLRAYLSKKLNCDPMRISKKFAGARCLGKVSLRQKPLRPELKIPRIPNCYLNFNFCPPPAHRPPAAPILV
jgi:hypothetical protein